MLKMVWFILLSVFFLISSNFHQQVESNSLFGSNKKNLSTGPRLPDNYIKEIRPTLVKGGPVIVDFTIFVVDINSINVEDMDFRVDLFIRQSWIESRLIITDDIFEEDDDYVILPSEFFDNLWQPDPYFLNSKVAEIAALTHKFSSVMLYKNKTVFYSARMYAIVACQMEFQLYPMDIQICPIYIESFSHNSQKLRLRWGHGGVTVNPELKLLQYKFGQPHLLEDTNYISEKNGNFSRLVVFFRFERQIGHHLIQTFAPSTLVVMLSWFSFYLGLDAIPGRVTLLVTSMLTLVTMFTGLKTDIPPVAYVKALDLWMAGCMIFVFSSLGEFIVVKVLDLRRVQLAETAANYQRHFAARLSCYDRNPSIWDYDSSFTPQPRKKRTGSKDLLQSAWLDPEALIKTNTTLSKKIDRYSRIIFPTLFLFFVLLYWPIVMFKKKSAK